MDAVFACCPLPILADGTRPDPETIRRVLSERIADLSPAALDRICEAQVGLTVWERFTPEDVDDEDGARPEDYEQMRQRLREYVEQLFLGSAPRDCGELEVDGRPGLITGGQSFGDEPSDSYAPLVALIESGITKVPLADGIFVPPMLRRALEAYNESRSAVAAALVFAGEVCPNCSCPRRLVVGAACASCGHVETGEREG